MNIVTLSCSDEKKALETITLLRQTPYKVTCPLFTLKS